MKPYTVQICPKPMTVMHQLTQAFRVCCHLQPYKRSASMVRNCGVVLIRIRHAQNVIRSNQYPIKFVSRGIGKVPPYTSCFLRTLRNPKKNDYYMKKHTDLPYCGEDILPFLGSFKMFDIITDHVMVPPLFALSIMEP